MNFKQTNRLTISYRTSVSVTEFSCMQYRDSVVTNVRTCNINRHAN